MLGIFRDILLAVLGPGVLLAGYLMSDRRNRRAQDIDARQADAEERQATAAEGTSVSTLATQVIDLAGKIGVLDAQVRTLQNDNSNLTSRLDQAQVRLSAALEYVAALIRWVESGAETPAPQPGAVIAHEIMLPPAWLHPTETIPKPKQEPTAT